MSWRHCLESGIGVEALLLQKQMDSCLVEGDAKEEILQPPEPQPVPPILTPSPPSAYPTVTSVLQDNDRYHPKPVLHMVSSEHSTDLNENYNKSAELSGKNEPSERAEKRLERNLSFEIKKVPLQEGPRSFDGSSLLNRAHAIKIKPVSSCVIDESFKPQEQFSGDAFVEVSQNSCMECSVPQSNTALIPSPESLQSRQISDALPRPDRLLLSEKGQATWSLQGPGSTLPASGSEELSPDILCHGVKTLSLVSNTTAEHPSRDNGDHTTISLQAPLCFTNPLHSDDSDTDEMNLGGATSSSVSNVSTASATVSAATSAENVSARKVLPMSIARQDLTAVTCSEDGE
ncbi:PREDICTED: tyrosine-protein phosphatase non-receptor type 12-like, partial [Merops nubicus]|uniref:tyrosine-protein phosphatase non-receptor type 12-like n=1 Tax=Merops nubicus TaxID=57421 RepID=UPI0004F01BC4